MIRSKLMILTVAFAVLGVAGCAQTKVATILEKDNAQMALTLNKDGSVSVVGVGAGERIKPCEIPGYSATQDAGKSGEIPDEKVLAQCFPNGHVPGKILFQQNYTIGVREGSMCIYVWNNGRLYVYCDPPYNIPYSGH